MKLRLRLLTANNLEPGQCHLATPIPALFAVLEFYGEVPKAPDEDGPTVSAWQPVEVV